MSTLLSRLIFTDETGSVISIIFTGKSFWVESDILSSYVPALTSLNFELSDKSMLFSSYHPKVYGAEPPDGLLSIWPEASPKQLIWV